MYKKILIAAPLILMPYVSSASDCCGYGYKNAPIDTKPVLKLYKKSYFIGLDYSMLTSVDNDLYKINLAEIKWGRETRTDHHASFWDVFYGQDVGTSGDISGKITGRGGFEVGYSFRKNMFNLNLSAKLFYQHDEDYMNGALSKYQGAGAGLKAGVGYHFTDDFYIGLSYQKDNKFMGSGLVFKFNL